MLGTLSNLTMVKPTILNRDGGNRPFSLAAVAFHDCTPCGAAFVAQVVPFGVRRAQLTVLHPEPNTHYDVYPSWADYKVKWNELPRLLATRSRVVGLTPNDLRYVEAALCQTCRSL